MKRDDMLENLEETAAWLTELADEGDCAGWVIEKHLEQAEQLRAIATEIRSRIK